MRGGKKSDDGCWTQGILGNVPRIPHTDASTSQPMCVVGIRGPPGFLQIILMTLAMFWILVAVPARDGGHAYSGGNLVLYLSTRAYVNQLHSSHVRK